MSNVFADALLEQAALHNGRTEDVEPVEDWAVRAFTVLYQIARAAAQTSDGYDTGASLDDDVLRIIAALIGNAPMDTMARGTSLVSMADDVTNGLV